MEIRELQANTYCFKVLVYLYHYNADTIANVHVDYLYWMQRVYESEIGRMQDTIDNSKNSREVSLATKRKEKMKRLNLKGDIVKIICQYNNELENFLGEVVEYTLNKYGQELNLVNLQEIELRDISEFDLKKDGTTYENGTKIMVTSRLYDMLPCLSVEKLENNSNFKMIVNTLYHEMGHITDWAQYPRIYAEAESMENKEVGLPALFWIEYIAEKRSQSKDNSNSTEFCEQFVKGQWHAHYISFDDIEEENFFYMNKVISYFMARTVDVISREKYMNEISNELLKEYLCELRIEIERLENLLPFDEPEKLHNLYDIMNKYYKKFCKKYKPIRKWYI